MIPDLAVIIAAYVCFRMIEVFLFDPDRYRGGAAHVIAASLAVVVILVTIISVVDITTKGTTPGLTP